MNHNELHKPEAGKLFRHYKRGGLYRVLFETAYPGGLGVELMKARCASDGANYEWIRISAGAGGVWTQLGYRAVVYVALGTGAAYVRKHDEFYGYVTEPDGATIQRFTPTEA